MATVVIPICDTFMMSDRELWNASALFNNLPDEIRMQTRMDQSTDGRGLFYNATVTTFDIYVPMVLEAIKHSRYTVRWIAWNWSLARRANRNV